MNTKYLMLATLLLSLTAAQAVTITLTAPETGITTTSASGDPTASSALVHRRANLSGVPGAMAVLEVIPFRIAAPGDPTSLIAQDAILADAITGTLRTNLFATNPTQYVGCNYRIGWTNLTTSVAANTFSWASGLNPVAPFNTNHGQVVCYLVHMRSVSGADDISLANLAVTIWSSDGNSLGDNIGFVGLGYTTRAFVITASGKRITDGDTSQQGRDVYVLIFPKVFTGGGTANGRSTIQTWVTLQNNNFTLACVAQIVGNDATKSGVVLDALGVSTLTANLPRLVIGRDLSLSVTNGAAAIFAGRYFKLWSGTDPKGPWVFEGIMTGSNALSVDSSASPVKMYRASVQ